MEVEGRTVGLGRGGASPLEVEGPAVGLGGGGLGGGGLDGGGLVGPTAASPPSVVATVFLGLPEGFPGIR